MGVDKANLWTAHDHQNHQLLFPPFHRSILSQSSWNAADPMGRIRVEMASGYLEEKYGRFVKVVDHVIFAFQPGPMGKCAPIRLIILYLANNV